MTLRPTIVSPESMKNLRPRKDKAPVKKLVIDCKNDTQWNAIHTDAVNGVVLRRRPIRAMETYLDNAPSEIYKPREFVCAQSRLRTELNKHLVLASDDDELRRKFLTNDIANYVRVFINQTRSRDFLVKICQSLPTEFSEDPSGLKLIMTYRDTEITFRQPKDKDERSFSPYGVALFRGQAYEAPVEWLGKTTSDKAFYLTVEPYVRRMSR